MERGNAKHGAREDDELKHELRGTIDGTGPAASRNGVTPSRRPTTTPTLRWPYRGLRDPDKPRRWPIL
ncbi:MAG: hypothetical protein QOH91_3713 [Mycobacterium sp.]|jgi:hypothetical protein|nr:hypothetical protein [Mycobacterium sp.]